MASLARQSLLRQTCKTATSKPFLPSRAAPFSTFASKPLRQSTQQSLRPLQAYRSSTGTVRIAAFHTTGNRQILPPLPQHIEGTANDAVPVPGPDPVHGNYHWTLERAVSILLIPVTIAPFAGATAYPILDASICALLLAHSHMGFQSIITDYVPRKRIPKTRKLFDIGVWVGTFSVAVGLYEFETNDVGITEGVKRIWTA